MIKIKSNDKIKRSITEIKEFLNLTLNIFIFILSVGLIFSGTMMFYTGYHNYDLGHNMRYLESEFNTELVDYYEIDQVMTSKELIITGVDYMRNGFLLAIIGAFLYGYMLKVYEIYHNFLTYADKKIKFKPFLKNEKTN